MDGTDGGERVVREFCAAFEKNDAEALRPYFTDNIVYHNMPMDPIVGIEPTIEFITGFFGMFENVRFEILHLAVQGDAVLTERVDTFERGGTASALPVMGAFDIRDGRICAWRDYFDMAQITAMLSGDG
jgi:limonene-1,2-epoxide hydrolase